MVGVGCKSCCYRSTYSRFGWAKNIILIDELFLLDALKLFDEITTEYYVSHCFLTDRLLFCMLESPVENIKMLVENNDVL